MDSTTALLGKKAFGIQDLPDNMAEFLMAHASTLEISVCHTDVESGTPYLHTILTIILFHYQTLFPNGFQSSQQNG